jgi:hypothetical protein
LPTVVSTQGNPASQAARRWRQQHEHAIVDEYVAFLKIPNLSKDTDNIRRNADSLVAMLSRRGAPARLLEVEGAPPAVYAELRVPGATRTVVLYAHYDGQPVDPAQWMSPPWQPVLRTRPLEQGGQVIPLPPPGGPWIPSRAYARAGDDKAPSRHF